MLLLNYLGRKRSESGLVAGFTVSVPWDAQKSSVSMEEPLNWLLFNKYLTSVLCGLITRSDRLWVICKFANLIFTNVQRWLRCSSGCSQAQEDSGESGGFGPRPEGTLSFLLGYMHTNI